MPSPHHHHSRLRAQFCSPKVGAVHLDNVSETRSDLSVLSLRHGDTEPFFICGWGLCAAKMFMIKCREVVDLKFDMSSFGVDVCFGPARRSVLPSKKVVFDIGAFSSRPPSLCASVCPRQRRCRLLGLPRLSCSLLCCMLSRTRAIMFSLRTPILRRSVLSAVLRPCPS